MSHRSQRMIRSTGTRSSMTNKSQFTLGMRARRISIGSVAAKSKAITSGKTIFLSSGLVSVWMQIGVHRQPTAQHSVLCWLDALCPQHVPARLQHDLCSELLDALPQDGFCLLSC